MKKPGTYYLASLTMITVATQTILLASLIILLTGCDSWIENEWPKEYCIKGHLYHTIQPRDTIPIYNENHLPKTCGETL